MILGYLDAGTGSLILQTVLGGAAGVAVLLKSTGRRFFKRGSSDETATADSPVVAEQTTES
jgi:hypothetical protein